MNIKIELKHLSIIEKNLMRVKASEIIKKCNEVWLNKKNLKFTYIESILKEIIK